VAGAVETVTISGNTYSVYGLGNTDPVGDADEYFAARLGATSWTGATADEKAQALVTAVRFLDRGATWSGEQTDPTTPQPLQWPRDGALYRGEAVTDGTTPERIVLGEFELALALLEDESVQDAAGTGSNVKLAKAGSAEVQFFRPTAGETSETRFPTVVHELVGGYMAGQSGLGAPYVNGVNSPEHVDQIPHFDGVYNNFDLSQGHP
jgi:hypothetical protein